MKMIKYASSLAFVMICSCADSTQPQSDQSQTNVSSFNKSYGKYKLNQSPSILKPKRAVKRSGNTWNMANGTTLKLHLRGGIETSPQHFQSNSTYSIIKNGIERDTKMSSYYYKGKMRSNIIYVYASENSILIQELPVWSNRQHILFTRSSPNQVWTGRYITIPTAPILGEGPEPKIIDLSDSHLIINDDGKVYKFPLKQLPTTKADNPFIVG